MNCIARIALALTLLTPAFFASPSVVHGQVFSPTGRPAPAAPAPAPTPSPSPEPGSGPVFRPGNQGDVSVPPAQPSVVQGNSQVEIAYQEPQNPQFRPIRDRLMKRRVLEQLRMFLSPLKLPRKLLVQLDQCNAERRPYQSGGAVTICYEYVAKIEQMAPRETPPGGLPRELMLVGAFVQTVLHEVSVAIFDVLEIPVWGREEDAADKLAGFIMVQFGKEIAQKVMVGAAWFFDASDRTWTGNDFANVQSPEAQRFFNYLCIAFGADPNTFKFLIDQNLLPVRRAQRCTGEYYALRFAFHETIMPHVDQALMKQVQSTTNWLSLDEPR